MKLKRTGKFWLVVARPLVLPIGAALAVFGLSSWGEYAARSQEAPSHVAAKSHPTHGHGTPKDSRAPERERLQPRS
jgi:hypothetical protein